MHSNPAIAAQLAALNNPSLPGVDLSLERVRDLLAALGNPENKLPPVIHVAGTNGKGSTLAFLRAMYEAAGYRVHAYTSPHLVRFNERIVIAGAEISDDYLQQLLAQVNNAAQAIPVTFFEATTAAAFLAFAEHNADVVLLETGMGGRLDATNVVAKPLATVITPIDYDHMEFLGESLAAIATEKAGIMKQDVPCFVGQQKPEAREVLKRTARERDARLYLHDRDWSFECGKKGFVVRAGIREWTLPAPSLPGAHQHHNAALAVVVATSLNALPVDDTALANGVRQAVWPARMQHLMHGPLIDAWGTRGEVYLDGGHNPHAAEIIAAWMTEQRSPVTLMLGMMARKDAAAFLKPLVPHVTQLIAVPIPGSEAECYAPEMLAAIAREVGIAQATPAASIEDAAKKLTEMPQGILLIAGSLFLAGEILKNHS